MTDAKKLSIEERLESDLETIRQDYFPEQVIERIAEGKLEKYYQEFCLLEQTYIKDSGKTIKDLILDLMAKSEKITLRRFKRFHLGEQ